MSRQAQAKLPPRIPLQKRATNHQSRPTFSPPSSLEFIDSHPRQRGHKKSISESFAADDDHHPPWLNDLLEDSDKDSHPIFHRRAASDSLHDLLQLQDMDNQLHETESVDSCGLESNCSYGPNSPRMKDNLGFPEREIASAFSEYSLQSTIKPIDGLLVENNSENKLFKRHPGQRSRARKLQYIAELETTVETIQNLGLDLSAQLASLLQQHTALSMENSTLKQQLLRVQQEKYIVDGEYRSLKKEVERLRTSLPDFSKSKSKVHERSSSQGYVDHSDAIWNMLNMAKLDLN